ncbi:hypothetical protein K2O51_22905 [Cupriavidus pinatubonensis]|uniref:hypothetical protein n=1 Tax=Cupriavidus pinatubonensis TaxID=248026 RepID=UPI001C739A86|nr:hypothetical protein [Cupriavidus pinatubonensis]QYY30225.1 hypothetical protein K2O51_22905 [Cupriavidus pinatubonensis]
MKGHVETDKIDGHHSPMRRARLSISDTNTEMIDQPLTREETVRSSNVVDREFLTPALLAFGATFAALIVFQTVWWETRNLFAVPWYDDMFDHVRMHHAMTDIKSFIAYMVSPHNEHRIFTTRLISFLDERFLSGREYGQVLATNLLQALAAVISWVAFTRSGIFEGRLQKLALLPLMLVFFINPNFLYTLIVPFQLQFGFMTAICVGAALAVSSASAIDNPTRADHGRLVFVLLALAGAATFTLGNSPVVLLASAATAVILRWRRPLTFALIGLAILHVAIMLAITPANGARTHNPLLIIKFSLMYLGGTFTRVDPWPASFLTWSDSPYVAASIGAFIFATAIAFAIARFLRPGLGGRLAVFGFMLLTAVIITSLAGGLARAQFGILEALNKKYASFASMAWLGTYAVLSGVLLDKGSPFRRLAPESMVSALAIMVALTLTGASREERLWEKARNGTLEAALAGFVQVNNRDAVRALDDRESEVPEYMHHARAHNLGVYSYFPFRMDDDASLFFSTRQETSCRGEVEAMNPVSADSPRYYDVPGGSASISGWAWMSNEHKPATTVIAVDSTNHIVGAARSTRKSERAEQWLSQSFNQNLGWFGYARTSTWNGIKFYALSSSGDQFCPLGPIGSVR